MKRKLLVLRHAKAEQPGSEDHERVLTEAGREAARLVGHFLTAADHVPDVVLSSTAKRALETAELAYEAGGWSAEIQTVGTIYEAEVEKLVGVLKELEEDVQIALLVGHEPGCSNLVSALIGGGELAFATGAVACIELGEIAWKKLEPGVGQLRWLVGPDELGHALPAGEGKG